MLITFFLIVLFILCIYWKVNKHKTILEPPEISWKLPIIGHIHHLIMKDNYNYIVETSKECNRKGGIATLYLGFKKFYVVTDPDTILTILNTCTDKQYVYSFMEPTLGQGLITAKGDTWKYHRKLLSPAFNQGIINDFISTFNCQARQLVELLNNKENPRNVSDETIIKLWNLESVCLTATGIRLSQSNNGRHEEYLYLVQKLQHYFNQRVRQLWLHNEYIYNISDFKISQHNLISKYMEFTNAIIKEWKQKNKSSEKNASTLNPFLEHVIDISQKNKCFTDEEIREETDTFIGAGHETTSSTLYLVIILLGSYPDIQEKAFNEILGVVGDSDKDLDKYDLLKLTYTEAVLKESMRLYPVVPVIARSIDKELKLKNFVLKKDTSCIFSIYGINRNSNWGPDADQFKPERWLDAATLPDNRNNFGTFSLGKRNCIGQTYAMVFMKTTLAYLIRSYRITADINKVVIRWHMTTFPDPGQHFTLERRKQ